MRFVVFGAGSLGSLVAARLAAKFPVALVGRRDHVAAIRKSGLRVEGYTEATRAVDAYESTEEIDRAFVPDVVLVTVKAYDSRKALGALERFQDRSTFVSLQNGLGNEEILASKARRVVGAVINHGVTFVGPGVVYHAGEGETELGPFPGTEATREDAERIASAFQDVGLEARVVEDVRGRIWRKVILNAAVNPLTALLHKRTGEILEDVSLKEAVTRIVAESVDIAAGEGVDLQARDILETVWNVARATKDNKSSMLQDLERGRKTEIDAINGALVELATRRGIAAPLNELLCLLVRAAEPEQN